jgi:hypothetical protein
MKLALYQIEHEFIQLAEQIIDADGEVTPEQETALSINREQLEHKGRGYGFVIKEIEYQTDIIDAEIKRLQALSKTRKKAAERLREALSNAMQLFRVDKIETATLKISFRKSESVIIEDEGLLGDEYIVVTTSKSSDKTKIKQDLKAGKIILGATLQVNQNLQIK